ncbi:Uma2 family endonuclease [Kamptonema sp. UHCC 0994]|uniref:Uma2 family endonuclease n=1 Tax=Kamptonema sp. UHCC 0994 TaxID=3031329 RepID=UPI0023B93A01|nr:Uma2 family endonuclease [Kamptonema sp. UHCC 0994]MDF0551839.1 Uma2 family endonuclease [Kamptonema sp. UHCC 0994]
MTAQILEEIGTLAEQRLVLPSYYTWEQFEAIEILMADTPGLRITYFDGCVEFMTLSEQHEMIKTILGFLIELYFCEINIRVIPVGSATRRDKTKDVSFEPDESYYIGEKKEHPDLAVEVAITSGNSIKLAKYQRLKIAEVWIWENNQLSIYRLQGDDYQQISRSEFLPNLDLDLLVRCVLMPSIFEARNEFIKGIS